MMLQREGGKEQRKSGGLAEGLLYGIGIVGFGPKAAGPQQS